MPRSLEKPVIIEAVINGATSKLENPRVPWSAEERTKRTHALWCLAALTEVRAPDGLLRLRR